MLYSSKQQSLKSTDTENLRKKLAAFQLTNGCERCVAIPSQRERELPEHRLH